MNQLALKGARPSKEVRYAPLWSPRFWEGIITQASPFGGGNASHYELDYYGPRNNRLIDGLNCEVSTKLTLIRRPGLSVYNSATVSAVNRFYDFHLFTANQTQIKVIADTASGGTDGTGQILDVTGPSISTVLFSKSAGAKSTYFQSVGNNLYFSDGVDTKKLVGSLLAWKQNTFFNQGDYIIDPNGNIQLAVGSQTVTITNIQIDASGTATIFFGSATPLDITDGTNLTLAGLTTVPALNGTWPVATTSNSLQATITGTGQPARSYTSETGTATTGNGATGPLEPTFSSVLNAITKDGGAQWECRGNQVQNWGIASPATFPTVTQTAAPTIYPNWAANTWYSPYFVIVVSGNVFQLTTAGTTGGSAPAFNTTPGSTTADGTAVWTCLGTAAWQANHSYVLNSVIQVSFTYYITVGRGLPYPPYYETYQQAITVTTAYRCTTAGTSGSFSPDWTNGVGTTVNDNSIVWTCIGTPPAWPGATQTLSLNTQVLDSNGNVQTAQSTAESGTSAPTWSTTTGSYTTDNTQSWLNSGPYSAANTGDYIYAYSYVNSVVDAVSTASAQSSPILVSLNNLAVIQGQGSADPQVDKIYLWRTVQGGSTLFYLDQIPNPGAGQTWIYTDTIPNTGVNELISAPVSSVNNPPPTGLSALTYHLQRIFGAVNNTVYYSDGPDVTVGNGNDAWSPSNFFTFPDTVTRLFPTASGLIVFTVADIYIIQGLGTSSSPLFSAPYLQGIGLSSYDAFAVNGSIVFLYTSDNQVVMLDPSSGVSEVGFPIGDQFGPDFGTRTFTPTTTKLTWHVAGSWDKGLYVSDSQGTWWRLCPTPSPESGLTWSPKAQPVNGFSCVQSVEVTPGTHLLLVAPKTSGPILQRDYSIFWDNGSTYHAWAILGSIVLAQPGQLALVDFITTDSVALGNKISIAVQLDEISPYIAGKFETLASGLSVDDPTQLAPSTSIFAQRFYLSDTGQPAACRHLQIYIDWGTDNTRNELLALTLYGGFEQES